MQAATLQHADGSHTLLCALHVLPPPPLLLLLLLLLLADMCCCWLLATQSPR
jgi:hypothetical protein